MKFVFNHKILITYRGLYFDVGALDYFIRMIILFKVGCSLPKVLSKETHHIRQIKHQ